MANHHVMRNSREAGRSAVDAYRRTTSLGRRRRAGCAILFTVGLLVLAAGWAPDRTSARWPLTTLAVVAAFTAWRGWPAPDPERWLRGAAGEAATAVLLERLPRRYRVLHDRRVPGSRANLDHVVIGPTGVWVLDSKAYRSRLRARRRGVWAGSHRLDVGPVQWEATKVADRLGVDVRPIVVVHGHGLPARGSRSDGVLVVPAVGLLRRLAGGWRRFLGGGPGRARVAELAAACERAFPPAGTAPPSAGRSEGARPGSGPDAVTSGWRRRGW